MEVYLSIDEVGLEKKPQAGYEIVGVRKRTAKGWRQLEVSEAARLIGEKGYTVIPGKMAGGLKAENCKAMQVFMLDFDDGISYREIEHKCEVIGIPIAFAYHTFSSTEEKERFRVAFVHESLIDDPFIIKTALLMLKSIFLECDTQCSNPDRMFYGGKDLICLNEDATFALVQLLLPFFESLDSNKNFTRNIKRFASENRIAMYNKSLAMGDHSFYQDILENDGKRDPATIHIIGETPFPSFCVIESVAKSEKLHQGKSRRQEQKNLDVDNLTGCRLLDDFLSGEETSHDQRFVILTNLMRIKGGTKLFYEAMQEFYDQESIEKWQGYRHYMKEYRPKRCSEEFCPYYSACEQEGTIVETLARDRKVYCKGDTEYYPLEEASACMKQNIRQAYSMRGEGIHLIQAQTGLGKSAACIELIKEERDAKFIIAVPTIRLRDEIYWRLVREGVPADEMFLTKNINGNPLIPVDVQKAYVEAHERGEHDLPKKIIQEYYEKIRDSADMRAAAEECRLYLEGMRALQGERIIVTTHAYFINMPRMDLREYTVIIDEDILQLYFLKQMPAVSIDSLQAVKRSAVQPYVGIAEKMLDAEEDVYTRISGSCMAVPLSREELEQMGCTDASNVNDIAHAKVFVKTAGGSEGKPYVQYFCPGQLPKAKYIILSATLNEKIYKEYFGKRMAVYSYPYLKAQYSGKMIQYTYHSLGRTDLRKKKQVFFYAKMAAGNEKTEIITFKEAGSWEEMRGCNSSGLHFGNAVGVDRLAGKDMVVIGTPYLAPSVYKLVACYLGSDVNSKADKAPRIRRVDYKEYNFLIVTYEDPLLRVIQLSSIESEMEQCIGRARLLRNECSVYVFSCFPCEQARINMGNYLLQDGKGQQEDQ